ncbi:MAG: P-loop NTPase [Caldilineaceae bacterium]
MNLAVALAQEGAKSFDGYLRPQHPHDVRPERQAARRKQDESRSKTTAWKSSAWAFSCPKARRWFGAPHVAQGHPAALHRRALGRTDYLIVDLPPGTGDAQLSLAQSVPLTGGVIVTGPQAVSVSDAKRGATAFMRLEVPILGVIGNMSGEIFGSGGGERAAQELGVEYLGQVELIPVTPHRRRRR